MRIYIVIFLLSFTFLATAYPLYAADKPAYLITQVLSVSPVILDVSLTPGRKDSYPIRITNLLTKSLGIHVSIEGFNADDEETTIITGENNPLLRWSSTDLQDFLINPHESKTITLSLTPPKNAAKKGYYEVVFLTPIYTKQLQTNTPQVLSRIGVLVLGTIGKPNYQDVKQKVTIQQFSFTKLFYENTEVTTLLKVHNNYFTHFSGKPFVTISPLFGTRQTFLLPEKRVLPGKNRRWEVSLDGLSPYHLLYKAHLAFSVGNGEEINKDSFFFIIPFPIRDSLIVVGVLLLGVLVTWRRKPLQKAFSIMLKG